MAQTRCWLMLAIMVVTLAGCGRTPTAPEGAAKKNPSPVHTRTALPTAR